MFRGLRNDVDDIARRLDRYTNFVVYTAARVTHLALQHRDKVSAITGLALPQPVLRKLYRENAPKWVPGIVGNRLVSVDAAQFRAHGFCNAIGEVVHLIRVSPLHHDSSQSLRARKAYEHAARILERGFGGADFGLYQLEFL